MLWGQYGLDVVGVPIGIGMGTAASVKLQAAVDLCTGALVGPLLVEGKAQDRNPACGTKWRAAAGSHADR